MSLYGASGASASPISEPSRRRSIRDRGRNESATQDIVVEEVLPHAPETIWKTLTTGELIARWLMKSTGFEPVEGKRFTLQTKPAGAWDGAIHCEVLEVMRNERLSYSWQGGHDGNAEYGSRLDTVVTGLSPRSMAGQAASSIPAPYCRRTPPHSGI